MSRFVSELLLIVQQYIVKKADRERNKQYVFMFHSICERKAWYNASYCMTPGSFENMIKELEHRKYRFLPIKRLRYRSEKKEAYLTFDDGFADFYTNAYPILVKHNIPFTLFITPEYINREHYLTWEQLVELSRNSLCTLGGHTYTHKKLSECSLRELKKEIVDGKYVLENAMNCSVNYLAYPYGSLPEVHILAPVCAKIAGYKKMFSTIGVPVYDNHTFIIPRVNINEGNWKLQIVHCR